MPGKLQNQAENSPHQPVGGESNDAKEARSSDDDFQ